MIEISPLQPRDVATAARAGHRGCARIDVPRQEVHGRLRFRGGTPRIRMLDGFNEGWIEFSDRGLSAISRPTPLAEVIGRFDQSRVSLSFSQLFREADMREDDAQERSNSFSG
jgi:hypothetical protein